MKLECIECGASVLEMPVLGFAKIVPTIMTCGCGRTVEVDVMNEPVVSGANIRLSQYERNVLIKQIAEYADKLRS